MGHLIFETHAEAEAYQHGLLLEVAGLLGLPVTETGMMGVSPAGEPHDQHGMTARWSDVMEVSGGYAIWSPDWRELTDAEQGMYAEPLRLVDNDL